MTHLCKDTENQEEPAKQVLQAHLDLKGEKSIVDVALFLIRKRSRIVMGEQVSGFLSEVFTI